MPLLALKLDRKLLDQARVFIGKIKPNGHTPEYLDLLLWVEDDFKAGQFGDCGTIRQSCTKEEREQGVKMPIIGNAKLLSGGQGAAPQRQAAPARPANSAPRPAYSGQGDESTPF